MPLASEENRSFLPSAENDAPWIAVVARNCSIVYSFEGRFGGSAARRAGDAARARVRTAEKRMEILLLRTGRRSAGPGSIRHFALGNREGGQDAVGVAEVEHHALRDFSHHLPGLQVDDEQRLAPDESGVVRPLRLHPREDRSLMVAEGDRQSE